ncbi:MAG: hypothetical protein OXQ29_18635 [Rhodospirillaceae bacterium]|nr:hypothetical protein [Rhodospirillaceae bacterium]
MQASLERMKEAERKAADKAKERRRKIRKQKQLIAEAERAEFAREAEDFWRKLSPGTRERLRGGGVPQQAVALLGLIAFDRLAANRFPSQNLRTMAREAAEDPDMREGLRPLLGPDPPGDPN